MGERVYHYTSVDTLLNILKNYQASGQTDVLEMWASSIYTMNDPTEMQYAYDFVIRMIAMYEDEHSIELKDRPSRYMDDLKKTDLSDAPEDIIAQHIYNPSKTPFVFSCSKLEDHLPMWRMYGDNGRGVCLCFDRSELEKIPNWTTMDVSYNKNISPTDETYQCMQTVIFNECERCYQTLKTITDYEARAKEKIVTWGSLCAVIGPFVKDEAYKHEQEMRMSLIVSQIDYARDVMFRLSPTGQIVPYTKLRIPINALVEIVLGPAANRDIDFRNMDMLLKNYDLRVTLTCSKRPFRLT